MKQKHVKFKLSSTVTYAVVEIKLSQIVDEISEYSGN